ncbi:MAG: YqaJ viral recombinase family protein [Actinomycetales bacterium]|nr:YqaJ viral recombinase family protein [Actinomycetales bacterium]
MSAPAPGSAEWSKLVTASKVAAIIGVSPWDSPRSMWAKMRGEVPSDDGTNAQAKSRGQYLEAGILAWWHDQHPEFTDHDAQRYVTRPDLPWAAATLDDFAWRYDPADDDAPIASPVERVIVEAKSSSEVDEWGQSGTDEIPTHVLTQVYWQLAMTPEAARCYVALLGPFLRFEEYVVERDEAIQADLIARCHRFYLSLSADVPPPLDDHVATFEVLRVQRGDIAKGVAADVDPDFAAEWWTARVAEDAAVDAARLADSRLMEAVGNAQYVTAGGVRVARQQNNRKRPIPVATPAAIEGAAA